MKKIAYILFMSLFLAGCKSQTDGIEQWLGGTSYSDRPSNLEISVGFERAELRWTNPSGPIAKKILIEYSSYGEEMKSILLEEMVDRKTINGLTSGYGYDFSVYTLDAAGTRSLPATGSCIPFSSNTVTALEEALVAGYTRVSGGYALKWDFPDNMTFDGKLAYKITGSDGFTKEGTEEGGQTVEVNGKVISFVTPLIPELSENTVYDLTTEIAAIPSDGEVESLDAVQLKKNTGFELVAPKYQVAFNTGAGASSVQGQLVLPDQYATRPAEVPTHPDKTFVGWRMPSQRMFGEYFDFEHTPVTQNLTLYAVWIPKTVPGEMLPEMVDVPGGSFSMGDSWTGVASEQPLHNVMLSGFEMARCEMTQELFKYMMNGYNPADVAIREDDPIFSDDKLPVNKCHWFDAVVFCNLLSITTGLEPCYSLDGETDPRLWGDIPTARGGWTILCDITKRGYRLPTEAEWEYACGGGGNLIQRDKYAGTNVDAELYQYAWCASEAEGMPHEGGLKRPNILGIYDLSGNVMEWCSDTFASYTADGLTNPIVQDAAVTKRVTRGGSFKWNDDSFCRTSWRDGNSTVYRSGDVGFRVVRSK